MLATSCYEYGPLTATRTQHYLLLGYYAATVLFVLSDWLFGVNVRVAFLDESPGLRAAYYVLCAACFLGVLKWPRFERVIAGVESTFALAALIIGMALRAMFPAGLSYDGPFMPITTAEIANFVIAGFFAYVSFWRGMRDIQGRV